jgi:prepilin-type N-terminal cleavage/methylation domain-containing protein
MNRSEQGFTMVELLITMVIFLLVIVAASQVFVALLTQFKQQSKISASNTEGIVGLEIMRRDLAQAGYGLPWVLTTTRADVCASPHPACTAAYSEAVDDPKTFYNDTTVNGNGSAGDPPKAVESMGNVGITMTDSGGSVVQVPNSTADVLTIRAADVAVNDTSQKWTYVENLGLLPNAIKTWQPPLTLNSIDPSDPSCSGSKEDLSCDDRIIVIDPIEGNDQNVLQVDDSGTWYKTLGDDDFSFRQSSPSTTNPFEPKVNSYGDFIAYGIAPSTVVTPRMPFNRADYYVKIPQSNMPSRCAPNTGILYKAVINNDSTSTGGVHTEYPLLDCVADVKVDYWLVDSGGNPVFPPVSDLMTALAGYTDSDCADTACKIRKHLMEVRVYIVAQEGQKDINYDFSMNNTRTRLSATEINPDPNNHVSRSVNMVDLSDLVGPQYKYYRWKLYTLVVQPNSMR